MRMTRSGVPQGSVLGPIFYSLYTNELPELSKIEGCPETCHLDSQDLFGRNCEKCGIMPCYADDCTVTTASKNPVMNKQKLSRSTRCWNELSEELRHTSKISTFKIKLKKWLIAIRTVRHGVIMEYSDDNMTGETDSTDNRIADGDGDAVSDDQEER